MADQAAQAAADVVSDLIGDYGAEAPELVEPAEQPAPVEPEAVAPAAFDIPTFEADTDGIEDLLTGPDDEEPPYQPAQFQTAPPDEEPAWVDESDEAQRLRAENAKLQKRLAWAEEQRVNASKKQWREEAARRFPLADVEEIDATSRRAFLRKAQEQHTRYDKKLSPIMAAIDQLREAAVAETKAVARAEAEQAWGKPVAGPQLPAIEAGEQAAALDRRNYKNPYEMLLARMKNGFQV